MIQKKPNQSGTMSIDQALGQAVRLLQNGRHLDATRLCRAVLNAAPKNVDALHYLGIACAQSGDAEEATAYFRKALEICPDSADLCNNLGNALRELTRYEEAIASLNKALSLRSDFPDALNNLGIALNGLNRREDAIVTFRRILETHPDFADAYYNLGVVLADLGQYDEADANLRTALQLRPHFPELYLALGGNLGKQKRYEEAISSYKKVLELRPDSKDAFMWLSVQRRYVCDWQEFAATKRMLKSWVSSGSVFVPPFYCLSFTDDPTEQLLCARRFAEKNVAHPAPLIQPDSRDASGPIRVAYLSADFREHPVAHLAAELFEKHDRRKFEIHAISFGPDTRDPMRKRLAESFDQFHDIREKSDREGAELIRRLGIHIAVDLMGYTQHSRPSILAYRPAPIQVNFLGYPCTMGAGFMDYILIDAFIAPDDQEHSFTENPVKLPNSYMVNDTTHEISGVSPSRKAYGLPESGFVFCCFNNNYKITPELFDSWMRLLKAIPGSVLWLFKDNAPAERNLRQEAGSQGINPDRLIFAERVDLQEHFARHQLADLFLDTFPYNAHTTASDALWAGLPVVTWAGRSFASRVAGSLLHTVGLPELVTYSLDEYEALAIDLAGNPELLGTYRRRLAEFGKHSPLFDCERFARNIEAAYTEMVARWADGRLPEPFSVSDNGPPRILRR